MTQITNTYKETKNEIFPISWGIEGTLSPQFRTSPGIMGGSLSFFHIKEIIEIFEGILSIFFENKNQTVDEIIGMKRFSGLKF